MSAFDLVAAEIEIHGPISFSRYMELALYDPEVGFYAHGGAGRRRDFITSPEVGPLFGAVVARALDTWWEALGRPDPFSFVEVGAGPGTLARGILRAAPECAGALDYVAVETSEPARAQHPAGVASLDEIPGSIEHGVVLANELLDNLPFDVLQFEPDEGWLEIFVDRQADRLVEQAIPTDRGPLLAGPPLSTFRIPVQTRAAEWLTRALGTVVHGRVVVVDYAVPGYPVPPDHEWLRTYTQHGRAGSPLSGPGTKDITADVDLAALRAVQSPTIERSQSIWLRQHGIHELVDEGRRHWEHHAASPDLAAIAMRSRVTEAEALLDPTGLGGFCVLEWELGASD